MNEEPTGLVEDRGEVLRRRQGVGGEAARAEAAA